MWCCTRRALRRRRRRQQPRLQPLLQLLPRPLLLLLRLPHQRLLQRQLLRLRRPRGLLLLQDLNQRRGLARSANWNPLRRELAK